MTERSWVQTTTQETIFQAPFIWTNSLEQKEIMECSNLPGIVTCAAIPLMGGWTLRLIKSNFITKDEHEACQLTRTKVQQKKAGVDPCGFSFLRKWVMFEVLMRTKISQEIFRSLH